MRALVMAVSLTAGSFSGLVATSLHADEECLGGYRDITPEEQAAMIAVLEGALRALAPPPQGWVLNSNEDLYVAPRVCRDNETEPWSYGLSRAYLRVDDRAQREASLGAAGSDYQAAMQAKQPRLDAIMARIQQLSAAAVAAAEKGDYDKVEAINLEIEQASAEYERVMAEGGTLDQLDAATDEANRDQSIRIEVAVNSGYEPLGYEAEAVAAPAGATQAFRWSDTAYSETDETEVVLLGAWRAAGDRFEQVPRSSAAPTQAQGISVLVTADESRIEAVLASIDFEALVPLLSR